MSFLKRLLGAFAPPPPIPEAPEKAKREIDRRAVQERANGNIRIQDGRYSTREDIEEEYEQVRRHKFFGSASPS